MKFLKLFGMFFHKNILKSLALLVVSVSSCIIFSTVLASCNYYYQSESFFRKNEILNSDYIMIYTKFRNLCDAAYYGELGDETSQGNIEVWNENYEAFVLSDVYGQIKKLPAVENVYSYMKHNYGYSVYNNSEFQMICSDELTYKLWDYSLSSGSWFWNTKESSEYPNAVLCGTIFENVDIGSNINITFNNQPYTVHVIGKVAAPYQTINFAGPFYSLNTFGNTIFVLRDKKTIDCFGKQILHNPSSAFVTYKSDATNEEIEQCREFYSSLLTDENPDFPFDLEKAEEYYIPMPSDLYQPTVELVEESNRLIAATIKEIIYRNFIILFISTFMFVVLSVLLVRKKQRDYSIYYFCGCSKRRTFLISLAGIASIAVVAGLICTGYMMWKDYIISHGMVTNGGYQYVFDTTVCLIVWGYLALCVLLSCIIPFRMIFSQKSSLISLYRKGKE